MGEKKNMKERAMHGRGLEKKMAAPLRHPGPAARGSPGMLGAPVGTEQFPCTLL